jgi:hypothetical protein
MVTFPFFKKKKNAAKIIFKHRWKVKDKATVSYVEEETWNVVLLR